MRFLEALRSIDWILAGATLLLVLIGLAMLFSATYTQGGLLASRFLRQAVAVAVALAVASVLVWIPYHVVRRYVLLLYALGVGGLVVVSLGAQIIRGAASRLAVLGVQLQPSEFMKIAIVITLAWLFARSGRFSWRVLAQSALVVALPVGLILLEPDVGVASLFIALWAALVLFSGLPWLAGLGLGLLGVGAFAAAWQWFFADYQRSRLLVFLDPTHDPLGAGYNILQSIVALGSGRLFGRGLGHGPQSQLKFLPEQHTDFILASIGEELGFVGVTVVLILYTIVLWRILVIARGTRDVFGQYVAVGTFLVLLLSLAVSAGMNMGLLPVTGIPLPLVSYGGSNLLSTFVLLALVQSVHVYSKWVQPLPTEISHIL